MADALEAGAVPSFALVTAELDGSPPGQALHHRLLEHEVPLFEVAPPLLAQVADTVSPQGVLAVVPLPTITPPSPTDLVLVLDAVRDPGNLGTALRTALAAGVDAVLLAPGTVEYTNPKVVRSGMGAHFRLPIRHADWATIGDLTSELAVWIADMGGERDYTDVDWNSPAALIVGSEAHGPSTEALSLGQTVRIPMAGPAESLNAAMAAAVILFEAARQRRDR